jgi:hypothetical protein
MFLVIDRGFSRHRVTEIANFCREQTRKARYSANVDIILMRFDAALLLADCRPCRGRDAT